MKAMLLHSAPRGELTVENVPEPKCTDNGVIIKMAANGICRSDWHEWNGDWDWLGIVPYKYPMIAGHEGTGTIVEVGKNIKKWKVGDRVIPPVTVGCGVCPRCVDWSRHNMCEQLRIFGYHIDGLFAEYAHAPDADYPGNLIKLPDELKDMAAVASLGCRYQTAYHGLVSQGSIKPGDKVAIWGLGGIGLVAAQVASSMGCYVIGIDIFDEKLELGKKVGVHAVVNAKTTDAVQAVKDITFNYDKQAGANVSVDALGIAETAVNSVLCLTNRGRHVQIGISTREEGGNVTLPVDVMLALELEWHGSLTCPYPQYDQMIKHILLGKLHPEQLVTRRVTLEEAPAILKSMTDFQTVGMSVVEF